MWPIESQSNEKFVFVFCYSDKDQRKSEEKSIAARFQMREYKTKDDQTRCLKWKSVMSLHWKKRKEKNLPHFACDYSCVEDINR